MSDIEQDIITECGQNPVDGMFLMIGDNIPGKSCWYDEMETGYPLFSTKPDILLEPLSEVGDCGKAAKYKNQNITVTIRVDLAFFPNPKCTPTTSVYVFTMPNF